SCAAHPRRIHPGRCPRGQYRRPSAESRALCRRQLRLTSSPRSFGEEGTTMPTLLTRTSRGRTAALPAAVLTGLAMAAPASAAPADSRDIPTEGLLASYDFSAESGAVLADRSGNDRDGAVVGTPSWHGGYMHFDGQNYVELPDGMLAEEQAATVIIETAPQHL